MTGHPLPPTPSSPAIPAQRRLEAANPLWEAWSSEVKPDGDVELSAEQVAGFHVPNCPKCEEGILKPYVVFFGDNVPRPRVEAVRSHVEKSDALLVVGSSLFVFSGYRLVKEKEKEKEEIKEEKKEVKEGGEGRR